MQSKEQSFLMAKRLKEQRERKGLSHNRLKAALFEQYGIKISRDSLMSYEIQAENHKKVKGGNFPNLNMGVEYLNAFAQFYNVSTDYLLGYTDCPIPYIPITEYTGLSEKAINSIIRLNKETGGILNEFFEELSK